MPGGIRTAQAPVFRRLRRAGILISAALLAPALASAHEAYVLNRSFFWGNLHGAFGDPFTALADAGNRWTFVCITLGIGIALLAGLLAAQTLAAARVRSWLVRHADQGALLLRLSAGAALMAGAATGSFLGPELPLASLGDPAFLKITAFAAGLLITAGLLPELGALLGLLIFGMALARYGPYMLSYAAYPAEFVALLVWGGGKYAWRRRKTQWRFPHTYKPLLIRAAYGLSLAWAALTVKFLHPALTVAVVENYGLIRFYLLFPQDPRLVALGAALAELAIGAFILLGFELRLVVSVSLVYITLSLLYFGEAVWPHFILYGTSLYLLSAPQKFSLDAWLGRRFHH